MHSRPSSLSPRFFSLSPGEKKARRRLASHSRVESRAALSATAYAMLVRYLPHHLALYRSFKAMMALAAGGRDGGQRKRGSRVYTLQRGRLANSAATSGAATKKHEHTHIIREARQSLLCVAPPPPHAYCLVVLYREKMTRVSQVPRIAVSGEAYDCRRPRLFEGDVIALPSSWVGERRKHWCCLVVGVVDEWERRRLTFWGVSAGKEGELIAC